MVNNCLGAILAAIKAGVDIKTIQKGISTFTPVSGRMNIYPLCDSITLLDDTYNANPASVEKALHTLHRVSGSDNSIAVLGDMLELGETSDDLHRRAGRTVAELGIKSLFVFGSKVQSLVEGAIKQGFPQDCVFKGSKAEIAEKILGHMEKKTWVLIKGSRGMAMEIVIQELKKKLRVTSLRG
jgi:UDP-N-acetylmuramyl pentapeptide synthase